MSPVQNVNDVPVPSSIRRFGFLAGHGVQKLLSGSALRAGTGPLGRVAEDMHLWPQTGRPPPCQGRCVRDQTQAPKNGRKHDSQLMDEWIGTGGECSERPPNPTLGTGKRLDPDSILDLAERMVGENLAPTRPFATATDFRNRMEARRTLQERFGVCFPAPTALWGLTVRFCVAAGDYKSSWTAATAKPTPTLIRKVFAFLSVGRFGGAQRPPRYASVSSLSPSSGRSMWFSVRCTGSTGITTCYFTRSLETHASLASY